MGKEKAGGIFKAGGIAYAKALRGQTAWHIWRTEEQRLGREVTFERPMEMDK